MQGTLYNRDALQLKRSGIRPQGTAYNRDALRLNRREVAQVGETRRAREGEAEMILLDSGAYTHVCPRNFAPEIPVVEARRHVGGLAANGEEFVAEGTEIASL